MSRSRIVRVLAVAIGLTLSIGTAALAADAPVADGDTADGIFEADTDGPNDAAQFGEVCPGGTYYRDVRLAARRVNNTAPNSFVNGTGVTWGFFAATVPDSTPNDGAQEVDGAYGHLSAEYIGTTSMVMPTNWQTRPEGSLWPLGTATNPFIAGRVTLTVPESAPAGDPNGSTSNGTARWRANGARTSGTDLTGVDRPMGNHWTVLDGGDKACDRAASATANFADAHVACGSAASLVITPSDPDAAITSEDGLTLDVDWGAGVPDTADVHRTGIKGNDPLTFTAPYATAGHYTVAVSWTDGRIGDVSFTGSTTASVSIDYDTSGMLQPINANGSSIFKSVSTIPVKVRFTDCDGSVPSDLAPTITVVKTSSSTPTAGTEEAALSTSAHTDGVMRFSDGQWIYNLSGKSLSDPSATYRLTIAVPGTGQTLVVGFALKA